MAVLSVSVMAATIAPVTKDVNVKLEVDGFLMLDNVPTSVTVVANTYNGANGGELVGSTGITYTARSNVSWTLGATLVPDITNTGGTTGITPTIFTPTYASGDVTVGQNGLVQVVCEVAMTQALISYADALQVGVVTLTLSAAL